MLFIKSALISLFASQAFALNCLVASNATDTSLTTATVSQPSLAGVVFGACVVAYICISNTNSTQAVACSSSTSSYTPTVVYFGTPTPNGASNAELCASLTSAANTKEVVPGSLITFCCTTDSCNTLAAVQAAAASGKSASPAFNFSAKNVVFATILGLVGTLLIAL